MCACARVMYARPGTQVDALLLRVPRVLGAARRAGTLVADREFDAAARRHARTVGAAADACAALAAAASALDVLEARRGGAGSADLRLRATRAAVATARALQVC